MRKGYLVSSTRAVTFLRTVDTLLYLFSRRVAQAPDRPKRILVANWAHLGDMLLSLPTFAALRRQFPDAKIDLLTSRSANLIASGSGLFDQIHLVDHFLLNRSGIGRIAKLRVYLSDRKRFLKMARARNYDVAIDLYSYFPPAAPLFWRCGIPVRCGFTSGGFGPLLTHPTKWLYQEKPLSRYGRDLLAMLWPRTTEEVSAFRACYPGHRNFLPGDPTLSAAGQAETHSYIVVHPGSGALSREWPEEKWAELLLALDRTQYQIVLCGVGPRETARVRRLSATDETNIQLFLDRSWHEFVSLVAGARAVICLDSSASHLAAAFAIPTVAIFTGTNDHMLWGPDNIRARVISAPTACAPCHRPGCDAMACVRNVTSRMVLDSLESVITRSIK